MINEISQYNSRSQQIKKEKDHMIILTNRRRKGIWSNSVSIHYKNLSKIERKGNCFCVIKAIYKKPVTNIIVSEKLECFTSNVNKTRISDVNTSLQHYPQDCS